MSIKDLESITKRLSEETSLLEERMHWAEEQKKAAEAQIEGLRGYMRDLGNYSARLQRLYRAVTSVGARTTIAKLSDLAERVERLAKNHPTLKGKRKVKPPVTERASYDAIEDEISSYLNRVEDKYGAGEIELSPLAERLGISLRSLAFMLKPRERRERLGISYEDRAYRLEEITPEYVHMRVKKALKGLREGEGFQAQDLMARRTKKVGKILAGHYREWGLEREKTSSGFLYYKGK